jgi:hypothetical protein
MSKIKGLTSFTLSAVLICGLIGCNSDKQNTFSQKKGTSKPWGVGTSYLLRNGFNRIKVLEAEDTLQNYQLDDEIVFAELKIGENDGIALKVTTDCFHEQNKIGRHTFSNIMLGRYKIYQFLPMAAIFNKFATETNPILCSIDLLAQNSNGDTHHMMFKPTPVIGNRISEMISIYRAGAKLEKENDDYFEVQRAEMALYTLDQLHENKSSYNLLCENEHAQSLSQISSPIHLDQFTLQNNSAEESTLSEQNKNVQLCRVFESGEQSQVLKMSDIFILRSPTSIPILTRIGSFQAILPIQNESNELSKFKITNPYSQDIVVNIDLGAKNRMKILAVTKQGINPLSGTELLTDLKLNITGVQTLVKDNQLRFVLKSHKSADLAVIVPFSSIRCRSGQLVGVFVSSSNDSGLNIDLLDDIKAQNDPLHVLSVLQLEPPVERYFYQRTFQNIGSSQLKENPAPTKGPDVTRFSTNNCAVTH